MIILLRVIRFAICSPARIPVFVFHPETVIPDLGMFLAGPKLPNLEHLKGKMAELWLILSEEERTRHKKRAADCSAARRHSQNYLSL
jgi:hypothetical protein